MARGRPVAPARSSEPQGQPQGGPEHRRPGVKEAGQQGLARHAVGQGHPHQLHPLAIDVLPLLPFGCSQTPAWAGAAQNSHDPERKGTASTKKSVRKAAQVHDCPHVMNDSYTRPATIRIPDPI